MNPVLRNILAVLAGLIVGNVINMSLVYLGGQLIPMPAGMDSTNMEAIKAALPLLETKHFLFPFLAHAVGTLAGAFTAVRLSAGRHLMFGLGIGLFFLLGGIAALAMIGGPMWFAVTDLVLAYLPMGWLGGNLAGGKWK